MFGARWFGVIGWVAIAIAGCGEHATETVAERGSQLQIALSPEIEVEPALPALHVQTVAPPPLSCAGAVCVALYRQCLDQDECWYYAARISAAGQLLDTSPIHIGSGNGDDADSGAVTSNGVDEFLFTWEEDGNSFRARMKASDGSFNEPATSMQSAYPSLSPPVSDGASYLFTDSVGNGLAVRLLKNGVLANAIGVPGTTANSSFATTTVAGPPGQYLVVWSDGQGSAFFARFDTATRAFLDAPPIRFTQFYPGGKPHGVYVGGVYLLAWQKASGDGLSVLRVNPNGTVLDPDDTFNGVTTAKSVASGTIDQLSMVAKDGAAVLLWRKNGLVGVRVDPATGAVPTGDPNPFLVGASDPSTQLAVATGSDGGLFTLTFPSHVVSAVTPLAWHSSAPFGLTALAPVTFALLGDQRSSPVVASNGSTFLTAWYVNDQLFAARVDAHTAAVLDSPPLAVANAPRYQNATIVSDGTDYVIAWGDANKLYTRKISADGVMGPAPSAPSFTFSLLSSSSPVIGALHGLYNGAYYWFSLSLTDANNRYAFATARLAPGALTPSGTYALAADSSSSVNALAVDTSPDAAHRTVLVANLSGSTPQGNVLVNRVRSDTGSVLPSVQVSNNPASTGVGLSASSDGTSFLVAWNEPNDAFNLDVALVDPLSGQPLSGYPKNLMLNHGLDAQWHDGLSYVFLSETSDQSLHSTLSARRYDAQLNSLDAADTAVALDALTPVAASDGKGHSLVVFTRRDPQRQDIAVKARLLSDDGQPWLGPVGVSGAGGGGASGGGSIGTGGGGTAGAGGASHPSGGSPAAGSAPIANGDAGASEAGASDGDAGGSDSAAGGATAIGDGGSDTVAHGGAAVATSGTGATDADAGAPPQETAGSPDSGGSSGCSCRLAPSRNTNAGATLLLVGLSLAGRRRRRRR